MRSKTGGEKTMAKSRQGFALTGSSPKGAGFVVYLRLECPDDREMVRLKLCSGAREALRRSQLPDGVATGNDAFYYCLRNCRVRRITIAHPDEIKAPSLTGQLRLLEGCEEEGESGKGGTDA